MKKPLTRVAALDAQISALSATVSQLTGQREFAALALVEQPDGDMSAMHAIDAELLKVRAELEHLQAARNAAARRDAVDDRAERLQRLKSQRDEALKAAADRVTTARKIEDSLGKLRPLFEQMAELSAQCRTASALVGVDVMGSSDWALHGHNVVTAAAGEGGGMSDALAGALVATGLGTLGPRIDAIRDLGHETRANLADAAALDGDRLKFRLDELVKRAEKDHEKRDKEVMDRAAANLHRLGAIVPSAQLVAAPIDKD